MKHSKGDCIEAHLSRPSLVESRRRDGNGSTDRVSIQSIL